MSFYDQNNDKITVGIKTFERPEVLEPVLNSLIDRDFHRVIIADDGRPSKENDRIYKEYAAKLPLEVIRMPFDTGLSAGRNAILKQVRSDYFLLIDDDYIVPSGIGTLIPALESRQDLAGIGGNVREKDTLKNASSHLRLANGYVVKHSYKKPVKQRIEGIDLCFYDFIPNCALFKSTFIKAHPWDPFYKIGSEHLDFYLNLKLNSHYKFAVAEGVFFTHLHHISNPNYNKQWRHRKERINASKEYFQKKWGVRRIIRGRQHYPPRTIKAKKHQEFNAALLDMHLPLDIVYFLSRRYKRYLNKQ